MFLASAHGLMGYELAMCTTLRDAIYHFRFDYRRTQVIRVNDTRDYQEGGQYQD